MALSTERFKKLYTLSEAQKALPLVRSIVTDLVETWGALNEAHVAEAARAGQKGRREEAEEYRLEVVCPPSSTHRCHAKSPAGARPMEGPIGQNHRSMPTSMRGIPQWQGRVALR